MSHPCVGGGVDNRFPARTHLSPQLWTPGMESHSAEVSVWVWAWPPGVSVCSDLGRELVPQAVGVGDLGEEHDLRGRRGGGSRELEGGWEAQGGRGRERGEGRTGRARGRLFLEGRARQRKGMRCCHPPTPTHPMAPIDNEIHSILDIC
jgi:hypothetical protein